ncbi:MFS transporter [Roseobacter weihaiensis]|uniref:MFS transporter n=1 Tax=Roseobacter weihaiensis TaxID=2763262 RepID=UPI001D0B31BA|nr:MFS transporter [Roseobacter sp. H9]
MGLLTDLWVSRKPLMGFALMASAWAAFFAQMPVIKQAISASDGVYGAAMLLASLAAVAAMWVAPFADRVAGRLALPFFSLIVVSGMIGAGASSGLVTFTLAMIVASIAAGVVDVLANVRISEAEQASGRPLMNLNHACYSLAYAAAAFATGAFRELGWTPVEIFALLGVITLSLAWVMIEPASKPKPVSASEARASVSVARLLTVLGGAVVLVAFLVEASAEGWSALHLERTLGGDASEGALGPAILGLTMGVGRLAGHFLSRHLPELKLMGIAALVSAAGLALAGSAPSLTVAYLGFGLAGIGVSVVAPLALALIGRTVAPEARLDAISRVSVMGYGAYFFGPPLMGFTSEALGLRAGFILIAGIMVVTALLLVPALGRSAATHPVRDV